jgi:DNA invertase Pin-like site-specific DNA recombinase
MPPPRIRSRTQWQAVLQAASRRKIDLVLVWKLDRAFRSVLHASQTLEQLRRWGVGLRSYTEPWADTTSAQGELVFNLLTTFAQFERSLIAERVKAGMARAKKQEKRLGRPRAETGGWAEIHPLIQNGTLSQRQAASRIGVSKTTIHRLLVHNGGGNRTPQTRI